MGYLRALRANSRHRVASREWPIRPKRLTTIALQPPNIVAALPDKGFDDETVETGLPLGLQEQGQG